MIVHVHFGNGDLDGHVGNFIRNLPSIPRFCLFLPIIGIRQRERNLSVTDIARRRLGLPQDVASLAVDFDGKIAVLTCDELAAGIRFPAGHIGIRYQILNVIFHTIQGKLRFFKGCSGFAALPVVLMQGHGGLVGRVDEIGVCRVIFSGGKRSNRVG